MASPLSLEFVKERVRCWIFDARPYPIYVIRHSQENDMTQLLNQAFQEASKLPDVQQNIIARWLLDELLAEKKWDSLFAESEDFLASLADEALREHCAGKTKPLNLDDL